MTWSDWHFRVVGALSLGAMLLCSCSAHQSFSSTPGGAYIPTIKTHDTSPKSTTVRVTNLESGVDTIATPSHVLALVNGSRLRISLTGIGVISGAVVAVDSSAALKPTGEGQWGAVIRYVDSSNPPVQNPALEVNLQTTAGQRVLRIPVSELHQ